MVREHHRGQASVEWIGVVVALALLCGGLALWAGGSVAPPTHPPDALGRVVAPLAQAGRPAAPRSTPPPAAWLGVSPPTLVARAAARAHADGRLAAAATWLQRRVGRSLALGRDMGGAFGGRFVGRLRQRLAQFARDPGSLDLTLNPAELTGYALARSIARRLTSDPGRLIAYLQALRQMPPRDAAVRAAGDAGQAAADGTLEAAKLLIKRMLLRGVLRTRGGQGSAAP